MTEKQVTMQEIKGQVILYKNQLEVRLEGSTVWLNQEQIAFLFGTQRPVVACRS